MFWINIFLFKWCWEVYSFTFLFTFYHINLTSLPEHRSFPVWWKLITSGNDDKAAFGFLVAAAVAMFGVPYQALPRFFNKLVANFLLALADNVPRFLKKLPYLSAFIILLLTMNDFFLIQTDHCPTNNLTSSPVFLLTVISPFLFFLPDLCLPPKTIYFKFLRAHLKV